MPDLHEGREPRMPKSAMVLIAVALLMICGSFFVQGAGGSQVVEHGLTIGAVVAIALSAWLGMRGGTK